MSHNAFDRRSLLKASSATLIGGIAAASLRNVTLGRLAQESKSLHIVQATGMVDAADLELQRILAEWADTNGFEVNLEIVSSQAMPTKIAAAASAGSGPDIFLLQDYEPWLHASSLADVGTTVEQANQQLDGVYEVIDANAKVDGVYRAVPFTYFPSAWLYRKDWFAEQGHDSFPETMDGLLEAGRQLKDARHPIGWSLAANNGDARANSYSVLWNFGGRETDESGTEVLINSPETLAALTWAQQFFQQAADPAGFGWDGGGNNRAYAAGTIAATINGASIYIAAKNENPELAGATGSAVSPAGPGGGWIYNPTRSYGVMKWSPNPAAAQDLILHLLQPSQFNAWLTAAQGFNNGAYHAFDEARVFADDPKLTPFIEIMAQGRWPGWPGSPNANAAQVWQQDVIVNMFAAVQQGASPEDAMRAAEDQIRQIYG